MVIVTDNIPGNNPDTIIWSVHVIEAGISLQLKTFLEGAFMGSEMATHLNSKNLIPLSQPYHASPWNYYGTEEVLAIPGIHLVDWVLVELRDAPGSALATESTTIARMAAFINKDGWIRSLSGGNQLSFPLTINDSLYVVITHRNHLGVMSAKGLIEEDGIWSYDFTASSDQVFGGINGSNELSPGIWGMVGGDANSDGVITLADKTGSWESETGRSDYHPADLNMDGQINNQDKNEIWLPNAGAGSQVPD
jgi:hypothetical protein